MLLSVLSVFAVQILGFGVFQGRLITDEGMSTTVADASALKDMWVRVSTALDEFVFSLLLVFLDSLLSQRMKVMGGNMIFPRERQTPDWQPVPEQLIAASSTSSLTVQ